MDSARKINEPIRILITGVGGDIGQSVIKCLKESSYKPYLIGCDIDLYAAGKKEVDLFYEAPLAALTEKYLYFIGNILVKENCNYIIPTTEQEIRFYDANREFFERKNVNVLINNNLIITTFLNKYGTVCFLKNHGFPYPKTYHLSEFSTELEFPVIIKPEIGRGSKGVQICHNEEDINYFRKKYDSAIVQELIGDPDNEYTVGIFSDGKIVYSIAFRRYLDEGGRTKFAELINNDEIDSLARKVARACNLVGSINMQARKTNKGFIPFEINPRLSSTVYFRHFFGFRDVEWWLDVYEGKHIEYRKKYQSGIAIRTFDEVFFELK